jgi:predicted helicase
MRHVHPKAFERLVAECFRANWKPVETLHVGRVGDNGIDVILIMSDEQRWLIQCKCRQREGAVEGVQPVRELLGTLVASGEMCGIVVSTADHFSYHAQRLSRKKAVVDAGYQIKLVDEGILRQMLADNSMAPEFSLLNRRGWVEQSTDAPWFEFFRGGLMG